MEYTQHMGFDVRADTIAVAIARPGRERAEFQGTIPSTWDAVTRWIRRQADASSTLICYEAGPTGFGLHRLITGLGIHCQAIAPGAVPKRPTDRVKTDRRDAVKLAADLRAGSLTPIRIPTEGEEAFRDLIRLREQAVKDRSRIRHRVKDALLRSALKHEGVNRVGVGSREIHLLNSDFRAMAASPEGSPAYFPGFAVMDIYVATPRGIGLFSLGPR